MDKGNTCRDGRLTWELDQLHRRVPSNGSLVLRGHKGSCLRMELAETLPQVSSGFRVSTDGRSSPTELPPG